MAKTKVLTIAVQNQPGAVASITSALGSAKVNLLALAGTAHGTTGKVHLLVEDAKRARKALNEAKIAFEETGAEYHELANKPGALAKHLEKLAARGINLSSIHAAAVKGKKRAVVVYIVEVQAKAAETPDTPHAA